MKEHAKLFTIVLSLLMVFSLILTGCARAVDERAPEGNPPVTQTEMEKKFQAMYSVDEENKSITVISREYLDQFWQSTDETDVIRSLSTEEIQHIIEDSIRIYTQYETIILPGLASYKLREPLDEGTLHPSYATERVIETNLTQKPRDYEADVFNIYNIILYRLTALSSPEVFITGWEAMESVGGIPGIDSSYLHTYLCYIPNFSEETDRDYLLTLVGERNFTEFYNQGELFDISPHGESSLDRKYAVDFCLGESSVQIFPSEEMEELQSVMLTTAKGD